MTLKPCTIIIPAYNESDSIAAVVSRLKTTRTNDEILVIDDGSGDATAKLAEGAGARVISHPHNMGYGAALKTGIRNAKNEIVLFFDADGQHDEADIEKILTRMEDADMVVGARPKNFGDWARRAGKKLLFKVAEYLTERKIPDLNSGFRAVKRSIALDVIHLLPNGFSLTTTITLAMMRLAYRVDYLPINIKARQGNVSTVSPKDFLRTMLLIVRMITLFAPLKIYLPTVGIIVLIAIPCLVWDLIHHNLTDSTLLFWLAALMIFLFGLLADAIALANRKTK